MDNPIYCARKIEHAVLRSGFIGIVTGRNWSFKCIYYFSLFAYIVNSWLKLLHSEGV